MNCEQALKGLNLSLVNTFLLIILQLLAKLIKIKSFDEDHPCDYV